MSKIKTLDQLSQRKVQRYGWRPDTPNPHDLMYEPEIELLKNLPEVFSLRTGMPTVYDQLQLGSCTANAIGGVVQFQQLQQQNPEGQNVPSRLFIYYGERVIEGTVDSDAGAEIRDGIKVVAKLGAPPESDWPYDISKFAEKPPESAYIDALKFRALRYSRVRRTVNYIKAAIAAKHPIAFGFVVYSSFEDNIGSDGIMPMPKPGEEMLGGHAVVAMGYNTTHVEVRNSWGDAWGDKGYFWMPWQYIVDPSFCSDFWTIKVES